MVLLLSAALRTTLVSLIFMAVAQPAHAAGSSDHGMFTSSIYKLKETLHSKNYLSDEKTIVDRPIKKLPKDSLTGFSNEVDKCTAAIQQMVEPTTEQIDAVLNTYFDPIATELRSIDMLPFEIQTTSSLGVEIERAKEKSEDVAERVLPMLQSALGTLSKLARGFKVDSEVQYEPFVKPFEKLMIETSQWLEFDTETCYAAEGLSAEEMIKTSANHGYSTAIGVPFPFIIPGGRFGEAYYWDTYWVIKGLLASGNDKVALGQVRNFFSLIDRFGFVPNGLRSYYLERSQPPVLALCVSSIVDYLRENNREDEASDFMKEALPRLLKEYLSFWMNPTKKHVVLMSNLNGYGNKSARDLLKDADMEGSQNVVNRYYSSSGTPRIESYLVDNEMGKLFDAKLAQNATAAQSKEEFFNSVRAAAESGWDYSSRWVRSYITGIKKIKDNNNNMTKEESKASQEEALLDIDTINVAPIDLNAMMFHLEGTILKFCRYFLKQKDLQPELHNAFDDLIGIFNLRVNDRKATMVELMWNKDGNYWADYYLRTMSQSAVVSSGAIFPLLISGLTDETNIEIPEVLKQGWGILPTGFKSGLQWDSPNVWPPLLQISVEYLGHQTHTNEKFKVEAAQLGGDFLRAALLGYEGSDTEAFYEKYDSFKEGFSGFGGEYRCQVGFGWTNGALLDVASRVLSQLSPEQFHKSHQKTSFAPRISMSICALSIISATIILF